MTERFNFYFSALLYIQVFTQLLLPPHLSKCLRKNDILLHWFKYGECVCVYQSAHSESGVHLGRDLDWKIISFSY